MKEVQISDGIVPLGEFKAQAASLLKRLGIHLGIHNPRTVQHSS